MTVLRLIATFFLALIFMWLVFLFSWYVALPLLIVWAIFGGVRWIYAKIQSLRYRRLSNGCSIHRTTQSTHTTIIDADYTEIP